MRQHIAVLATADSHLELIRAAPDFSKLDEMLQVHCCTPCCEPPPPHVPSLPFDTTARAQTHKLSTVCQRLY